MEDSLQHRLPHAARKRIASTYDINKNKEVRELLDKNLYTISRLAGKLDSPGNAIGDFATGMGHRLEKGGVIVLGGTSTPYLMQNYKFNTKHARLVRTAHWEFMKILRSKLVSVDAQPTGKKQPRTHENGKRLKHLPLYMYPTRENGQYKFGDTAKMSMMRSIRSRSQGGGTARYHEFSGYFKKVSMIVSAAVTRFFKSGSKARGGPSARSEKPVVDLINQLKLSRKHPMQVGFVLIILRQTSLTAPKFTPINRMSRIARKINEMVRHQTKSNTARIKVQVMANDVPSQPDFAPINTLRATAPRVPLPQFEPLSNSALDAFFESYDEAKKILAFRNRVIKATEHIEDKLVRKYVRIHCYSQRKRNTDIKSCVEIALRNVHIGPPKDTDLASSNGSITETDNLSAPEGGFAAAAAGGGETHETRTGYLGRMANLSQNFGQFMDNVVRGGQRFRRQRSTPQVPRHAEGVPASNNRMHLATPPEQARAEYSRDAAAGGGAQVPRPERGPGDPSDSDDDARRNQEDERDAGDDNDVDGLDENRKFRFRRGNQLMANGDFQLHAKIFARTDGKFPTESEMMSMYSHDSQASTLYCDLDVTRRPNRLQQSIAKFALWVNKFAPSKKTVDSVVDYSMAASTFVANYVSDAKPLSIIAAQWIAGRYSVFWDLVWKFPKIGPVLQLLTAYSTLHPELLPGAWLKYLLYSKWQVLFGAIGLVLRMLNSLRKERIERVTAFTISVDHIRMSEVEHDVRKPAHQGSSNKANPMFGEVMVLAEKYDAVNFDEHLVLCKVQNPKLTCLATVDLMSLFNNLRKNGTLQNRLEVTRQMVARDSNINVNMFDNPSMVGMEWLIYLACHQDHNRAKGVPMSGPANGSSGTTAGTTTSKSTNQTTH